MNKKIILISIIVIVVVMLGIAGYFIFKSQKTGGGPTATNSLPTDVGFGISPSATPSNSILPGVELNDVASSLHVLASAQILAFWPASTTTLQYFTNEGFYEVDYTKTSIQAEKKDLGINFSNILSVEPSGAGKVLIKYVASGATQPAYSVLDIKINELKNLDLNIRSAAWSPDGQNIIFYYSDSPIYYQEGATEQQYLGQMNKDLAKKKTLINFRAASDIQLSWPTTTAVYITQKPSGYVNQTVLSFDPKNITFKPFVEGNGLILKWNDTASYGLLFSTSDAGKAPTLKLINKEAIVIGAFPKLTLPEKCVFSRKAAALYCAIPSELSLTAVWPDDYYQGAFNTEEAIYQINPESLEAQPLISSAVFEVSGIDLNQDESALIFYDKISGKLYGLEL
ncbi:MAG: hypothetical protein Q8N90_04425 [bacterium]|nr:hypothetical protein [bacterium]